MTDIMDLHPDKIMPEPNSGCWLWIACFKDKHGYGCVRFKGKPIRAHKASWLISHGPISDGLCVLHMCDTPPCVNPDHLFLGTQRDNVLDMLYKGKRYNPRTLSYSPILNANLVQKIRADKRASYEWARELGISSGTIRSARRGKSWRHV